MRLGIRAKILIFAALAWAFIFGAYSVYLYKERVEQTRRMAINTATLLAREIVASRQYYASTVVKRALDSGMPVTSSYHDVERSIPTPTSFLREVSEATEGKGGFHIEIKAINPVNPASTPADAFQKEGLDQFAKGTNASFYRFEVYKDKRSLRYMVPDVATSQTCTDCHNRLPGSQKRDYKIGDVMGGIEIVVPIETEMEHQMSDIWRAIGYGFAVVLTMGFIGLAFVRKVVTEPILNLSGAAKSIAQGDLTVTARVHSQDEIGNLAKRTNEVVSNLHTMIEDIRRTSDEALKISSRVSSMSRHVLEGSERQGSSIDAVVKNMEGVNTSMSEIGKATGVLAASADKGSSSVLELGAGIKEVVDNTELLFATVDETAQSTRDMSFSIKEISENIENLSSAIMQVSSSMAQINAKIKEVESNAAEAYRFADDAIRDAGAGMSAVESTIHGIVKIKDTTRDSALVIDNLCERIKEIGKILDVIRDVAEETNLLAINAAIIAAQSGEHGKSFSVVANEIKDLAERTSSSAKEVSEIIHAVEVESAKAGDAMSRGVEDVEDGVRLAVDAGEGLKKIVASAQRTTSSVREIARASAEQAKESRMVADATVKVADMTRRIVNATQEQAKGSELISKATERISDIAYKLRGSTRAQAEANAQITRTMEEVNMMASHINNVIREQTRNVIKALETIEAVKGISAENIDKAVETDRAVEEMLKLNSELQAHVKRFTLKR